MAEQAHHAGGQMAPRTQQKCLTCGDFFLETVGQAANCLRCSSPHYRSNHGVSFNQQLRLAFTGTQSLDEHHACIAGLESRIAVAQRAHEFGFAVRKCVTDTAAHLGSDLSADLLNKVYQCTEETLATHPTNSMPVTEFLDVVQRATTVELLGELAQDANQNAEPFNFAATNMLIITATLQGAIDSAIRLVKHDQQKFRSLHEERVAAGIMTAATAEPSDDDAMDDEDSADDDDDDDDDCDDPDDPTYAEGISDSDSGNTTDMD